MIKDTFDEATTKRIYDMVKQEDTVNTTAKKLLGTDEYHEMRRLDFEIDSKFIYKNKEYIITGMNRMTDYIYYQPTGWRRLIDRKTYQFKIGTQMDLYVNVILI